MKYLRPAIIALLALAALGSGPRFDAQAHEGGVADLLALDMDPTGNTIDAPLDLCGPGEAGATCSGPDGTADTESTTLGTIQPCIEVTHPETFDIDVVVEGYPWPGGVKDSLAAYDITITAGATGLNVTGSIDGAFPGFPLNAPTLISADPQRGPYTQFSTDVPPKALDLGYKSVVLDGVQTNDSDENLDGEENSDGFLWRLTLTTTAAGPALISLTMTSGTQFLNDIDGSGVPITTVQEGRVAVDSPGACASAPATANPDAAIVNEDSGANSIDVLANDDDGGSPPLTIVSVTQGSNGTVAITGGGTGLTYTPDADFFGADSFTYTIRNDDLSTDTATVNVTVNSAPDDPVANPVDMGSVLKNSISNAWTPDVSDPDPGDTLTCSVVSQPTHGTATVEDDCSSGAYAPAADFTGSDSFTYRVTDHTGRFDEATVTVQVVAGPGPTPTPSPGGPFNPESTFELADSTPGAASDINTEFNLPEGDVYFSSLVNFIPSEWAVARDADVTDGAILAQWNAQAQLGLLGSHCGNVLPVGFTMFEGTTDTSKTINPKPVGESDQLRPLMEDNDGNGIIDAADKYPSYLLAVFDPDWVDAGPDGISGTSDDTDGPLPPAKPIARQVGASEPPGTDLAVILNFLLFEPGTVLPDYDPFLASFGYPSVTVLQDPTVPTSPGTISDFCSPLLTNTTNYGVTKDNPVTAANEGGIPHRANPTADGFYRSITLAWGRPDADGDGHENQLDTCPFLSTPGWDPRRAGGGGLDPDRDGLPDACDPDPNVTSPASSQYLDCESGNTGPDEDQDCYSNRQDNCPLVKNGIDGFGDFIGSDNQEDTDDDGIGDACDTEGNGPTVADGVRPAACNVITVTVGSPSGSPPPFDCEVGPLPAPTPTPTPECVDLNDDGRVSGRDVAIVARALFSEPGEKRWHAAADLNSDERVDLLDLFIVISSMHDRDCR